MNLTISLKDQRYFFLFIGKRVLKSDVFNAKGKVPAFSANVFRPFGFLKVSNISDFDHNYILWSIDSAFKFNIIKKGTVFATTDHCGAIKILNDEIVPEYLLYQLELQSKILGYDRMLRPSLKVMEQVSVDIPTTSQNKIDLKKQEKLASQYMRLKSIKNDLRVQSNEFETLKVELKYSYPSIHMKIKEIFDLSETTNNSKFTAEFVNKNKGNIPVYSASKDPNTVRYGYVKDNLPGVKYFEDVLTWNIDGSVGRAFFRKGKFALSEKVIPLKLYDKWKGKIDPEYIKYTLEAKAVEDGLAYSNKAGKKRIGEIMIDIPSKSENGLQESDFNKQKEMASVYNNVERIKQEMSRILQDLSEIVVEMPSS